MRAEDVTLGQVRLVLRKLVRISPPGRKNPHVDTGYYSDDGVCAYTNPDGSPSCIVGNLADMLGVDRPAWDDGSNNDSVDDAFRFPIIVASYLTDAQEMADCGATWGEAVRWAEGELAEGNL